MLTPHDELLCHQLPTTFDHVLQSDLRWTERIVLYGFDTASPATIMTGMARYANRNVIDAYAMVTLDGRTTRVVRLSSEADQAQDGLGLWRVGPYAYEVVEPLLQVRASLAENPHGLGLQLDFRGKFPAYEQEPAFFRSRGRIREDARRYYQNGDISGWIEVDGEQISIDPTTWWFGRDHSWGTRQGGGGGSLPEGSYLQPPDVPDGVLYFMGIFQFEDHVVHFAQREDSVGNRWHFEGEILPSLDSPSLGSAIVSVDHDLSFRDDFRIVKAGTFTTHEADGGTRTIEVRPLSNFWPGLAGYDFYQDYASGVWKGPSYSDGFDVDITDPEQVRPASMLTETFVEARQGDQVGFGLVEMVFMGRYPRYGYEGW